MTGRAARLRGGLYTYDEGLTVAWSEAEAAKIAEIKARPDRPASCLGARPLVLKEYRR